MEMSDQVFTGEDTSTVRNVIFRQRCCGSPWFFFGTNFAVYDNEKHSDATGMTIEDAEQDWLSFIG